MKINEIGAFCQHFGFISSRGRLQLMKATVLAESSYFVNFHRDLSAPAMTTDMSQVSVFFLSS